MSKETNVFQDCHIICMAIRPAYVFLSEYYENLHYKI